MTIKRNGLKILLIMMIKEMFVDIFIPNIS